MIAAVQKGYSRLADRDKFHFCARIIIITQHPTLTCSRHVKFTVNTVITFLGRGHVVKMSNIYITEPPTNGKVSEACDKTTLSPATIVLDPSSKFTSSGGAH